ncbi:hypothetical protein GCM10020295_66310 [Streptomyces cinereospinus]
MRGEAAGGGVVAAREVAAVDPLHLDHPGAEVGELPGGEGGGDGLFDGDDGDARQGQGLLFHASDHGPRVTALSCAAGGSPGEWTRRASRPDRSWNARRPTTDQPTVTSVMTEYT